MVEGGEDGFRAWVAVRREPLRRSVYLMCGDWYLADDVVQGAMTRLYAVWERVARRGDPEAYARRIVVNLLIDHSRRPARREIPRETLPESAGPGSADDRREVLVSALAAGRVNSTWPQDDGLKWPHLVVVGFGRGRVGSCLCRSR